MWPSVFKSSTQRRSYVVGSCPLGITPNTHTALFVEETVAGQLNKFKLKIFNIFQLVNLFGLIELYKHCHTVTVSVTDEIKLQIFMGIFTKTNFLKSLYYK